MAGLVSRLLSSTDRSAEAHIVLGALAVIAYISLSAYSVIVAKQPFDGSAFGTGIALTFAGTGVAALAQGGQRRIEGGDKP